MTEHRDQSNVDEPAGVADAERVANPRGIRVLTGGPNPVVLADCRVCSGNGREGTFVCSACHGAGVVLVK